MGLADSFEIEGEEVIQREAKGFGSGGAHVTVPKDWIGSTVKIVRSSAPSSEAHQSQENERSDLGLFEVQSEPTHREEAVIKFIKGITPGDWKEGPGADKQKLIDCANLFDLFEEEDTEKVIEQLKETGDVTETEGVRLRLN